MLTALLVAAPSAHARTCTWTGGGDGVFWSDADNWQDTSGNPCVPGAGDTAIISGSLELTSSRTVNELQLTGTLTIDEDVALIINYLILDSGSIGGDGEVEVDQEADFSGGTISVTITLPSDSNNSCGSSLRIGSGNTFTNNGTLSGSCFIDMEAGTTIDNYGVIEVGVSIRVVGALDNGQEEVTPYPVVNNKPGATMRTGTNAIFNNEGTVDLQPPRSAEFSGGGTSNGTFIVPAETSPDDGRDNARLEFGERFGITPHDLTGATIEGGGTVVFDKFRSPIVLTNATYDLSGAPEARTRIFGADVTFPASMTFGGLGEKLYLSEEDGRPGILTVDHDVSVRELRMNSPSGAVAELGGSGTLTVTTFLDVDGIIREKAATFGPGVAMGNDLADIDNLDLTGGATVVNEGDIGDTNRIRMAEGTSWTNDGSLRVARGPGSDGVGIDALGSPSTRPTFTNNGTLQFVGSTTAVLGVDLDNAGTLRLGFDDRDIDNSSNRGAANVTGVFTNRSGAEIVGAGFLGWVDAAQVTNDGRVAPGNSVDPTGSLSITDFVMGASATLDLDLLSGAAAERDIVPATGTIELDGTLNVTLGDTPLGTYNLIGSNSSSNDVQISGTFSQVNVTPSGYTTSLNYEENGTEDNVTLDITATPYPLLAASPSDFDFRDAEVSDVETVEIENVGSGTLTLSGATLSGAEATRFNVLQPGFPVDLNTGETVEIAVQVTGPATGGSVSARLDLAHNGDDDGMETTAIPIEADQITNPNFGEEAGYFFANSTFFSDDAPSQPTFDWVDISSMGTDRIGSLSDESVIGPFSLGFTFRFFDQDYTEYWISSNGWISFTNPGGDAESFNDRIPDTDAPNALVAWFWDDLDPSETNVTGRHLYTHPTTVNGTDAHVITFERYPEAFADADGWITGQIVLTAGADATTNGSIKLQYQEHGPSIDLEGATVGIEDASGNAGLEYRHDDRGGPLFSSPLAVEIGPDATALPVELTTFDATHSDSGVRLNWATASEANNAGFAVERKLDSGSFAQIGFVEGAGTTATSRRYQFADAEVPFTAATLTYRLKQIDTDGTATYSAPVELDRRAPQQLVLHPAAPNPVRTQTTLRYELPQAGPVRITVYDMLGRRVSTLVNETQSAGRNEVTVRADQLSSGTYLLRLHTDAGVRTQKMIVVQ